MPEKSSPLNHQWVNGRPSTQKTNKKSMLENNKFFLIIIPCNINRVVLYYRLVNDQCCGCAVSIFRSYKPKFFWVSTCKNICVRFLRDLHIIFIEKIFSGV